jgi:hypothetical protein
MTKHVARTHDHSNWKNPEHSCLCTCMIQLSMRAQTTPRIYLQHHKMDIHHKIEKINVSTTTRIIYK